MPSISSLTRDGGHVYTTDLVRPDVDFPNQDIQSLTLPDREYDLVVCNHVLEHVPDDGAALREIARVLRPGGRAVITVPGEWKCSQTWEFAAVDSIGHYRLYGNDFVDRLRAVFAGVDVVDLAAGAPRRLKIGKDVAFVCTKMFSAAAER